MSKYRAEMLQVMKEHKMFSLPTSCRCGYKAKNDNWTDMEKHYETCGQFRNLVKIRAKEMNQPKVNVKSIGFDTAEKIEALVKEIRKVESENKGEGYKYLEVVRKNASEKMREPLCKAIKDCLDNPDKPFTCTVDYIKKN